MTDSSTPRAVIAGLSLPWILQRIVGPDWFDFDDDGYPYYCRDRRVLAACWKPINNRHESSKVDANTDYGKIIYVIFISRENFGKDSIPTCESHQLLIFQTSDFKKIMLRPS
jgi:hypothetical protein